MRTAATDSKGQSILRRTQLGGASQRGQSRWGCGQGPGSTGIWGGPSYPKVWRWKEGTNKVAT